MAVLTAIFVLNVSSHCLLAWPSGSVPSVRVSFAGFDVTAKLEVTEHWKAKSQDDVDWTTALGRIKLLVSRDEIEPVPEIVTSPQGQRDLTKRAEYFGKLLRDYKPTAHEVANRILRFFQYELSTPQIQLIPAWDDSLNNPLWMDEEWNTLLTGLFVSSSEPVPGLFGELGVKTLTPSALPALSKFIDRPIEASLVTVLLSDARTAWFDKSLRRTVLELAICTEVLVKGVFFAQSSPAGAAFDYMEDKGRISVRVLDFLDAICLASFSKSYKQDHPDNYEKIDHLFRCRNKVAHRGDLSFRDDAGNFISVDSKLVKAWIESVMHLREWLSGLP